MVMIWLSERVDVDDDDDSWSKCRFWPSHEKLHFNLNPVRPDGPIIFSIFGHLQRWKVAQWHTKFAKVGLKFTPMLN